MKVFKASVVTFIFGKGYETLREPVIADPDIEYICFTDQPDLKSENWNIVCVNKPGIKLSRFKYYWYKYHFFFYCHSDIVFRIDGSIQFKKTPEFFLKKFSESPYDCAVQLHPDRDNIKSEYSAWGYRGVSRDIADRSLENMRQAGMDPDRQGLLETMFSVWKRTYYTEQLLNKCYSVYINNMADGDVIEQIWFSQYIKKARPDNKNILFFRGREPVYSDYFQLYFHNNNTVPPKTGYISEYKFNDLQVKPVSL